MALKHDKLCWKCCLLTLIIILDMPHCVIRDCVRVWCLLRLGWMVDCDIDSSLIWVEAEFNYWLFAWLVSAQFYVIAIQSLTHIWWYFHMTIFDPTNIYATNTLIISFATMPMFPNFISLKVMFSLKPEKSYLVFIMLFSGIACFYIYALKIDLWNTSILCLDWTDFMFT